jgi:hypothetical protein
MQQRRRIVRVMLSVAVQSDHAMRVLSTRFGNCESKAGRFAFVQRMSEQRDGKSMQLVGRRIRGSVVDNHHRGHSASAICTTARIVLTSL